MAAKTPANALNAWAVETLDHVRFHLRGLDEVIEATKPELSTSSTPVFVTAKGVLKGDVPFDLRVTLSFDWIHHADKFVRVSLRFARPDRGVEEATRVFPYDASDSEILDAMTSFLYPLLDFEKAA